MNTVRGHETDDLRGVRALLQISRPGEAGLPVHIFLCVLAYYVEWHLREAWRPLMLADEDQKAKETRIRWLRLRVP